MTLVKQKLQFRSCTKIKMNQTMDPFTVFVSPLSSSKFAFIEIPKMNQIVRELFDFMVVLL